MHKHNRFQPWAKWLMATYSPPAKLFQLTAKPKTMGPELFICTKMIELLSKLRLASRFSVNTAGWPKTKMTSSTWLWAHRTKRQALTFMFTRFSLMMPASTTTSSGFHFLCQYKLWILLMFRAVTGWCLWLMIWPFLLVNTVIHSKALLKESALRALRTTGPFSSSRLSAWVATKWSNMTSLATWTTKLMLQSKSARTPTQKFQPHKALLQLSSQILARSQCGLRSLWASHCLRFVRWQSQYQSLCGAAGRKREMMQLNVRRQRKKHCRNGRRNKTWILKVCPNLMKNNISKFILNQGNGSPDPQHHQKTEISQQQKNRNKLHQKSQSWTKERHRCSLTKWARKKFLWVLNNRCMTIPPVKTSWLNTKLMLQRWLQSSQNAIQRSRSKKNQMVSISKEKALVAPTV